MELVTQTFQASDLLVVAMLVFLEALLAADNALVLSILVRHLPPEQRKRALTYGLVGAFVFRVIAVLLATWVLQLWWLQLIGGLYLLWLPIKHFKSHADANAKKAVKQAGFWATVVQVELADVAFAIDSIVAGVAAVDGRGDKLWVVWLGGIIGVIFLRIGAGYLGALLEKYPKLDAMAYVIIGWVGVKMIGLTAKTYYRAYGTEWVGQFPIITPVGFWIGMAIIIGGGVLWAMKSPAPAKALEETTEATESSEPPRDV